MFGEDRERTVSPFFFAITLRTYIRVPENRSMTDGDCPVPDDATVILVDSLERARFSITDVYVCTCRVQNNSSFPSRPMPHYISISSASSCNC